MKPFDLELALQGHPVVTRDGRCVDILTVVSDDYPSIKYPVVGVMPYGDGDIIRVWKEDGRYNKLPSENPYDLFIDDSKPFVKKPKLGDVIYVWDDNTMTQAESDVWCFVCHLPNGNVLAVREEDKDEFMRGEPDKCTEWGHWSWPKTKAEIEINVRINGRECKLSDISEETLLKIRNND